MPLCAVAATVYMASCESDSFMEDFGDRVSGDNINVISAQYGSEKMKPTEIYTDISIIY